MDIDFVYLVKYSGYQDYDMSYLIGVNGVLVFIDYSSKRNKFEDLDIGVRSDLSAKILNMSNIPTYCAADLDAKKYSFRKEYYDKLKEESEKLNESV